MVAVTRRYTDTHTLDKLHASGVLGHICKRSLYRGIFLLTLTSLMDRAVSFLGDELFLVRARRESSRRTRSSRVFLDVLGIFLAAQ